MDAYDAEAPHKHENAAEIVECLRESVGTHRTKAGLGAEHKQRPVGVHTTAGETLESVGTHQAKKVTTSPPSPTQDIKRAGTKPDLHERHTTS